MPNSNWGNLVGAATDMGSATTLENFINFATVSYPASDYALVLWDHGGGIVGCCEGTNDDVITPDELSTVLGAGIPHLAVIGFDACLMAMTEVAYQVEVCRRHGRVRGHGARPGLEHTPFLTDLAGNPSMTAATLAGDIVTAYSAVCTAATAKTSRRRCRPWISVKSRP